MIQNIIVNSFISKISQIRNGMFSEQISNTRDIFDARLMTFTSRSNNWLLGAVIGEVGANTFDHNFMFRSDVPKGLFFDCDSDPDFIYLCDFGLD